MAQLLIKKWLNNKEIINELIKIKIPRLSRGIFIKEKSMKLDDDIKKKINFLQKLKSTPNEFER